MAKKRERRREAAVERPEEWPQLGPEDRMSALVDYSTLLANYPELVAAEGEARVRESLDYLFYFLNTSYELLGEREFKDLRWPLDPRDYLVYELYEYVQSLGGQKLAGLGPELGDPRVLHMVEDGVERCLTPEMRRDIERRARSLARRRAGSVRAAQAEAVQMAMEDPGMSPLLVGLLVESFRRSLLEAVLELPDHVEREWEERDRGLDRWQDVLLEGQPGPALDEAIAHLQEAGPRALAQVQHVYYDVELDCEDEAFRAAMRVVAAIPAPTSFWLLRETLVYCPLLRRWAAEQMAAQMPDLACAYFRYLFAGPEPPEAQLAAAGLGILVAAHCPEAYELAEAALHYQAEEATQAETVQVGAWEALLALGNLAAIPVLRDYLGDEQANPAAKEELVEALERHPWREQIVQGQPALSGR